MNNREIAAVFWLGVLLLWAVSQREVRQAAWEVLKALIAPKIALPLCAMLGYLGAMLYVGSRVGLWDPVLVSDTVAWFVATGVLLFGKSVSVFSRDGSLRGLLRSVLGTTVFVEVFVNLYVLPLAVEFVLMPMLAFLGVMSVVAGTEDRFAQVKRLTDGVMTFIGFAFISYVAIRIAVDWDQLGQAHTWQRFVLPIWLTLGMTPFVVLLGLYSTYDTAFAMIRWASEDSRRRWRARLALLSGLHLRARDVAAFNGMWCKSLTGADTLAEARRIVQTFRERDASAPVPVAP